MNKLIHLQEFETSLKNYKVSSHGLEVLQQTNIVLLLAPSSAGRNTIITELLEKDNYYFIVSDTTRQPRINDGVLEKSGREYWFRTEEEMLQEIQDGDFLEAEVIHGQQVSGTSIREFEKARDAQKTAVTDIDLGGLIHIVDKKPDTHTFLILPPSFEEWQRRIAGRGEMTPAELHRRMETAQRIFAYAKEHPELKLVINDDLSEAVNAIDRNVHGLQTETERQKAASLVLNELSSRTTEYLDSLS